MTETNDNTDPRARARMLVSQHQAEFGEIPYAAKLIDEVGAFLGFLQLVAIPYTRDISAGPTNEDCAVATMLVSNPQGALRKDGDGWQKIVNDVIHGLRDERNALRAAIHRR